MSHGRRSRPHAARRVVPPGSSMGRCPACGKPMYRTRRAARQAAQVLYPGVTMRFYRCGTTWHTTFQDAETAERQRTRAAVTIGDRDA